MPTKNKIILTFLVILTAVLITFFEYVESNISHMWLIIMVAFLMIIGLWVFPEAKGKMTHEE